MPAWQVGVAQCHRRDPSDPSDRLHKGFIPYSLLTLLKSEGSNKHRLCAPAQIQSLSVNISKSFSQSLKKTKKSRRTGICDTMPPCTRVSYVFRRVAVMQPNTILFQRRPSVQHVTLERVQQREDHRFRPLPSDTEVCCSYQGLTSVSF